MANEKNLEANKITSGREAREKGKKGGKASAKARKQKKEIRERLKIALTLPADPNVAKALGKTGIEVNDNADAVVASIMKGVFKSNPQMIDRLMEFIGESKKSETRDTELEIAKERLEIERMKAELEAEKQKMWLEAMKNAENDEQEDDGFIEALTGTASDDWSDET